MPPRNVSSPDSLSFSLSTQEQETQHYSQWTRIGYWIGPVLIMVSHFGLLLTLFTGLSVGAWVWAVFLYWFRMLAVTAIYHRLLTHKAYRSPAWFKWVGSLVAASCGQMGPSWWKAHHLEHHQSTDQNSDPHDSTKGFWWSHYRWLLSPSFIPSRLPSDIEQDPVMRTIDRLHFLPLIGLGCLSYALGGLEYLAAFFVSTTLLFHGVALVNSVCHRFGSQPFVTSDHSRNNGLVAFLTLGEGWHNFHHAFPWSARQGIQIADNTVKDLPDFTFLFIRGLQILGIASNIRIPADEAVLAAQRNVT
ncbi:MAG: acyl-CoA desaturase [Prochlorotrichaceae cyanobacterium]